MLWLNLGARILLMASSFMANPPRPYKIETPEEVHFTETPNYITQTVPQTLRWSHNPITGSVTPEPEEEIESDQPEEKLPEWGGLMGNVSHWKARRLEKRAAKANRKAAKARAKYKDGARRKVVIEEKNRKGSH